MATATYTASGAKATVTAKLDKAVFAVEIKNHELVRSAYEAYLSNGRRNLAKTKTRGQVRGSTIKPWRQKGTGRARFGSRYNPIWRGGGIVFGPTGQENFTKHLNTKAKRLAVRQALSLTAADDNICVIENLTSKDGKTSELAKLLVKIEAKRNVLLVVDQKTPELMRSARNLNKVQVVSAKYLNVYDVLNADRIVFTQAALKSTTDWLTAESINKPANTSNEEPKS
jgi:large subunit ribosomal protein L4